MNFALVGRKGDTGVRATVADIGKMYAKGVELALAGDMLQVWRVDMHSRLSSYDAARTQRLTDKIVAARKAAQVQS